MTNPQPGPTSVALVLPPICHRHALAIARASGAPPGSLPAIVLHASTAQLLLQAVMADRGFGPWSSLSNAERLALAFTLVSYAPICCHVGGIRFHLIVTIARLDAYSPLCVN